MVICAEIVEKENTNANKQQSHTFIESTVAAFKFTSLPLGEEAAGDDILEDGYKLGNTFFVYFVRTY